MFKKHGIEILSATEQNELNTPFGRRMRNEQIIQAEYESDVISFRTTEALKQKAEMGYFPGSKTPVGYKRILKDNKKIIVPDSKKAPYIKKLFEYYSTGLYNDKTLADKLASEGFEHNNKPCSRKLITNILTVYNNFYIGRFTYNKISYNGNHKPIIDIQLYNACMNVRKGKSHTKVQKHNFLYRGLIKCANSEKLLTGELQNGKNKSGEYVYYRCPHSCRKTECQKCIKEKSIDDAILETLKSLEIKQEDINLINNDIKEFLNYQTDYNEHTKIMLEAKITKATKRKQALYFDKLDGKIADDFYNEIYTKLINEIDEDTIKLNAIIKSDREIMERLMKLSELCKDLAGKYLQLSNDKKREILNILCPNFFYDGEKLHMQVRKVFQSLVYDYIKTISKQKNSPKKDCFDNGATCRAIFEPLTPQKFFELLHSKDIYLFLDEVTRFIKAA